MALNHNNPLDENGNLEIFNYADTIIRTSKSKKEKI
jgi:hypothetical protein